MKTRPLIPTQSPETLMDAPAFNPPTRIPVLLPLDQFINVLKHIRSSAFQDPSEYSDGWINGLGTAIERIHERATGQPFDWNANPDEDTLDSSEQDLSLMAEPLPTLDEIKAGIDRAKAIPDAHDLYPYNRI